MPVMMLASRRESSVEKRSRVIIGVASDGIRGLLNRRRDALAKALESNFVLVLTDVRGTGASSPGSDRGQQGAATSHSATQWMLGETILAGQLRDLRAVFKHVQAGNPTLGSSAVVVLGDSHFEPLPIDSSFAYPRRIDRRPPESDPTGPLLAALSGLFEADVQTVICHRGLVSYRSALESPFVQVPHASIVPGLLPHADWPELMAGLVSANANRDVRFHELVDGRGRRVSMAAIKSVYELTESAFDESSRGQSEAKGLQYLSEVDFTELLLGRPAAVNQK